MLLNASDHKAMLRVMTQQLGQGLSPLKMLKSLLQGVNLFRDTQRKPQLEGQAVAKAEA